MIDERNLSKLLKYGSVVRHSWIYNRLMGYTSWKYTKQAKIKSCTPYSHFIKLFFAPQCLNLEQSGHYTGWTSCSHNIDLDWKTANLYVAVCLTRLSRSKQPYKSSSSWYTHGKHALSPTRAWTPFQIY